MGEFTVRADSVDVEQIMRQIRARIREKRGADYTEAELQQLANVKLEKFLDPRGVRSDLVEQFRKKRNVSPAPQNYEFEDTTLYETHRGILRGIRKLLNPILKLFFNPNRIVNALHIQSGVNAEYHARFRQREEMDPLFYEVIHNLVVEVTRLGIEVHNLKMRAESLSSRMDFDERRARSLEGAVQYRPPQQPRPERDRDRPQQHQRPPQQQPRQEQPRQEQQARPEQPRQELPATEGTAMASSPAPSIESNAPRPEGGFRADGGNNNPGGQGGPRPDGERRRRRRRRRRRPGQTMAEGGPQPFGQGGGAPSQGGMAGGASHVHADAGDDGPDDQDDQDAGGDANDQDSDPGEQ